MRVLVTGVAGFLGGASARHLQAQGLEVTGLDARPVQEAPIAGSTGAALRSVRLSLPSPELKDVLESARPQVVVHAAGPASVPASMEAPWDDFRGSVEVYAFLLDALRRWAPGARVVFLSSAAVYGQPARLPVREDDPLQPVSAYGVHKRLCEDLGGGYARLFGLQVCDLRIFSAYGEGLEKQVVFDVLQKLRADGEVDLWGTGEETRDFVYVEDVARAVECVVRDDRAYGDYNLASGEETRIAELAAQLRELVNPSASVRFTGRIRAGDPLRWRADISRLAALGFSPRWDLRHGLERVVAYWSDRKEVETR